MKPATLTFTLQLVFLAGCPAPGLHVGLTSVKAQDGYTSNTEQLCQRSDLATRIADRALVLSLDALVRSGHIKSYHAAASDGRRTTACLITHPEACRAFGSTAGPFGPTIPGSKYPLPARKAGCATAWGAWSAICWPPVCQPEWPNEPHCVPAGSGKSSTSGWEGRLLHEFFNVARARWASGAVANEPDYKKLPELFGPGGVESKMTAAYRATGEFHDVTASCE